MIIWCRFKELVKEDPVAALHYLQNSIYDVVDHSDRKETVEVHVFPLLVYYTLHPLHICAKSPYINEDTLP